MSSAPATTARASTAARGIQSFMFVSPPTSIRWQTGMSAASFPQQIDVGPRDGPLPVEVQGPRHFRQLGTGIVLGLVRDHGFQLREGAEAVDFVQMDARVPEEQQAAAFADEA